MSAQAFIQKQITDIKNDWKKTIGNWRKLSQTDYGKLLKFTLFVVLLALFVSALANTAYFNWAFYTFIAAAILLFFMWIGFIAVNFGKFGVAFTKRSLQVLENKEITFAYYKYLFFRYIAFGENFLTSVFNWARDRKKGERYDA